MTKLEGNLTPNVRFNAKGDKSLLVFRWGSQVVRLGAAIPLGSKRLVYRYNERSKNHAAMLGGLGSESLLTNERMGMGRVPGLEPWKTESKWASHAKLRTRMTGM